MGGGLFGTELYLNPKCLVFSAFILGVYWLPHPKAYAHKVVAAILLGIASYIALAWYDVLYDCNDRFKPTLIGWLSKPFKPAEYSQQYEQLPVKYKKIIRVFDYTLLGFIVIAFIYPFMVTSKH